MADIKKAQEIIEHQIENLKKISETLDSNFEEAVKLIKNVRGNIILVGVGKCEPVASKIASSLRSAGRPAYVLNPQNTAFGEAAAISNKDLLIIISPTGESGEIMHFLPRLRRKSVKVITLTPSPRSSIARASDVVLKIKTPSDATDSLLSLSTSLSALIIGETIVALLLQDVIKKGKMETMLSDAGEPFYTVADLIASRPRNPVAKATMIVKDALFELTSKGLGAISIVDEKEKIIGIITDGDVRRLLQKSEGSLSRLFLTSVDKVMTDNPHRVTPEKTIFEALELMEEMAITVLPIVNNNDEPVGMVHLHDLVQMGLLKKKPIAKKRIKNKK
ncbi:MAG: CBS domain-containing protein [bacterium]